MKKIKKESSTSLTYTPFENIKELLKQDIEKKKQKEEKSHE